MRALLLVVALAAVSLLPPAQAGGDQTCREVADHVPGGLGRTRGTVHRMCERIGGADIPPLCVLPPDTAAPCGFQPGTPHP